MAMKVSLYNSLTRSTQEFTPLDASNVRMYVCGPTVYDRAHLGNARSVVIYDVLFRLLREIYGETSVKYVRNITDVDDKIILAAKERKIVISELTKEVTSWFHADMDALNCLRPNIEPKATEHITQMIAIIENLIKNGNAYVAEHHVLFDVTSQIKGYKYGDLSGRIQEELESGARVKVESYKKNPNDFVLWKPADSADDVSSVFDSPWGKGRPGWHIECSAMSNQHLGADFDIHGGGVDLKFPHHENEIAQAIGAHPHSYYAKYWVHNGFLTVNGEKMSKSLGNFTTVKNLLDKGIKGEVIRFALLSSKYNEPLDWNDKLVEDAKKGLDYFYRALEKYDIKLDSELNLEDKSSSWFYSLCDDLNTPRAVAFMHEMASFCHDPSKEHQDRKMYAEILWKRGKLLGLLQDTPEKWFKGDESSNEIEDLIAARIAAKKAKNWAESDRIRDTLKSQGIILEDRPDGTTDWRKE